MPVPHPREVVVADIRHLRLRRYGIGIATALYSGTLVLIQLVQLMQLAILPWWHHSPI